MDGKKVYSIKINGVQESIDAVLALNKMLNELENRIQALEKKNIKINTGGSSSSKGTSALSEEAKLEKQIAEIDAKREAYSKEIYQNYLAAKDVLDETVKDQKQLAAAERLQADAYSNTMNGIKQKLADLKNIHFTTDISSDEFKQQTQEINALTQKLKELEEEYGVFSRNVGNYKSAFDGFEKIKVTIGGVVKEFDNLNQAQKAIRAEMGKLEYNSQQDTKMYKQLEKELEKVAKAQLRLNSAMNDAKASSKAMDDLLDAMEGFTALGQVGQGFSTLFGFDSSALEQQIAKLVALQNVLSGIEKIRQQMNTQEGLGKLFAKGSDAVDNFVMKITGAQKRMGMLVKDTRAASLAVQGLSKALKFVGGSIATLGLSVLLETLTKTIGKLKEWAFGSMDAAEATEVASSNFDVLNRRIKEFNRLNEKQVFDGIMTSEEALANKTKYLTVQLTTLLNAFKNLRQYSDEDWFSKGGIVGGLSKAQERFEDLQVDIINLDQQAKKSLLPDWIVKLTNGGYRAEKQFEKVGRALAIDFLGRTKKALNAFEQAKAEAEKELQEMGEVNPETQKKLDILKTEIAGIRHEMNNGQVYGTIFDNIEKFAKDSPFLVRAINNTRDAINALDDTINSTNVDSSKLAQLQIDAMKDGLEKQKKQIELNRKKELAEVGDNEELKKAVNAKYRREEIEAEKQFGNQYRAALADLASIRIELMKEGWEKEKKQLEHERDERIRAVQESEILVGERTAAIRELYRKKIEKAEKEWREQQLENYREYLTEIEMMNREAYAMEVSNSLTNVENRAFEKTDKADKGINESNYRDIDKMKEYYNELLKIELEAAKEEEEIRQEALQNEINDAKKDEEIRHERLVNASNGEYKKMLEDELITKEQYDDLIQKENAAHEATMNALDKRFAAESLATTQDGLDKMYNAYNGYYQKLEGLIRRKQDKIQNDLSDAVRNADRQANKNFGFFNAKELGKQYDEAIKKQKELITKIKGDLEQLEKDNKAGKVIGEAYEQEKENLEASLRAGVQTLENYEDESMKIVDKVVAQINQYFQILGQSVQQVFQAVWDYQDYALDKEQEKLDKWNEQLDKQLDEQEKIVEEHKNNVNSIEDELATARGDRRQHLIDQLNAEISAQRAAQKEEQRIQKEQEAAKKREEQLEKKRREQEYQRNVTQAFISWHLAIANGLATQPFLPVGIAMGALATVLGAVQYALVKSQKPYAKGGQLDGGVAQGKRHRDGGIPVLGGRASIEGGEFITNRQTTANNVDLLEFVNSKHRKLNIDDFIDFYSSGKAKKNIISMSPRTKFADGGQIPTLDNTYTFDDRLLEAFEKYADRPSVVSVVDINNKQDDVKRVQALAGLDV